MKKNILLAFFILSVIVIFPVITATACSAGVCRTSNQIRPANQIFGMNDKFLCCECEDDDCDCPEGNYCKTGDQIKKEILLKDLQYCGASGQVDISVFNYRGIDNVHITLRVSDLFPKRKTYTVWLLNTNSDEDDFDEIKIGKFKTTTEGYGFLSVKKKMDFYEYNKIVVRDKEGEDVLSGRFDFVCNNPEEVYDNGSDDDGYD